jgi:hypothetical protein
MIYFVLVKLLNEQHKNFLHKVKFTAGRWSDASHSEVKNNSAWDTASQMTKKMTVYSTQFMRLRAFMGLLGRKLQQNC